jgi:Holliday junction resolvase
LKGRKIKQEKDNQKLTVALLQDVKNLSNHFGDDSRERRKIPKQHEYSRRRKRISKNTAYKKGRRFEYRVKKHFEKLGYYVIRQYASKGAQDLTAIKGFEIHGFKTKCSEVLLIQCKNLKVERKLSKNEIQNLKALAKWTGGTPLVAMNVDHKLRIEEIEM